MMTHMFVLERYLAEHLSPFVLFLNIPRGRKPATPSALRDILAQELSSLSGAAESIQARADREGRDLSPDEREEINDIYSRFEDVEAELDRQPAGRKTDPDTASRNAAGRYPVRGHEPTDGVRMSPTEPGLEGRRFRDLFAQIPLDGSDMPVVDFARSLARGVYDPRMVRASQTEGTGAGGGFLVPVQTVRAVWDIMLGQSVVLPRAMIFPSPTNALTVPRPDIANRSVDVAGLQGRWIAEGGTFQVDTAEITQTTYRLNKLGTLIKLSNEWLEDVPTANANLFNELVAGVLTYDLDSSFFVGTGAGMPLGLINAPSAVTVAKESGQAADTILFNNIVNAWARLHPACQANAVWYVSPSVMPQLMSMQFPNTSASVPVFLPSGGLADRPYGQLMGAPVIPTEFQPHVGDKGDIILCDPSKYGVAMKPGMSLDRSDHRYFETDQVGLRGKIRCDARPLWSEVHTPRNDQTMTLSWCVMLADRS